MDNQSTISLNLNDRGVNEQNLVAHTRALFKYASRVRTLDVSSNEFFDDQCYNKLVPSLKRAVNLEQLNLDRTYVSLASVAHLLQ